MSIVLLLMSFFENFVLQHCTLLFVLVLLSLHFSLSNFTSNKQIVHSYTTSIL